MSGSILKLVAMISMLIDHTAAATLRFMSMNATQVQVYNLMRDIGRMAFPIYCYLLVEGFLHTTDVKKYLTRLGLFALLSEIPFDLAITGKVLEFGHQNVFFTLFLGLVSIWVVDFIQKKRLPVTGYVVVFICLCTAWMMHTDYAYTGVLVIIVMYLLRRKKVLAFLAGCGLLLLFYGTGELPALVGIIFVALYNGRRGLNLKYFFYLFYPVHLALLAIVREIIIR